MCAGAAAAAAFHPPLQLAACPHAGHCPARSPNPGCLELAAMPHSTSFGMLNKAGGCELQEQRHTPLQLQVRLRLQNTHIMNVELIYLSADFLLLIPALGMGFWFASFGAGFGACWVLCAEGNAPWPQSSHKCVRPQVYMQAAHL